MRVTDYEQKNKYDRPYGLCENSRNKACIIVFCKVFPACCLQVFTSIP